MLSASRYILAGSPHNCSFCSKPLTVQAQRRDNEYFCSELCADTAPQTQRRDIVVLETPAPFFTIAA
jgi:hypothetical protein